MTSSIESETKPTKPFSRTPDRHRDELMADWELAVSGENPYKIEPL
jgi:hypothetical protein